MYTVSVAKITQTLIIKENKYTDTDDESDWEEDKSPGGVTWRAAAGQSMKHNRIRMPNELQNG